MIDSPIQLREDVPPASPRDLILDILADGKPRSDKQLHTVFGELGRDETFKGVQKARIELGRGGQIMPAAGHSSAAPWGGGVVHRFILTSGAKT